MRAKEHVKKQKLKWQTSCMRQSVGDILSTDVKDVDTVSNNNGIRPKSIQAALNREKRVQIFTVFQDQDSICAHDFKHA